MIDRENFIPDLLIYDPDLRHFLVHIEFNLQLRNVQVYLIRKEKTEDENDNENEDDSKIKKARKIKKLLYDEEVFVKQFINNITFWLWKRAV